MTRRVALATAILCAGFCGAAYAASGEAKVLPVLADSPYGEVLINEDVLALVAAGVHTEVVVAKIDATASAFDTSVETLIGLSEAGIAAPVLAAMARASAASPVADEFGGTPCPGPGVYVAAGPADADVLEVALGGLLALDMDSVARIGEGGLMASAADMAYGILPTRISATVDGTAAARRLLEPRPEFWFCMPEAASPFDPIANIDPQGFALVAHKVSERREERRFNLASFWMLGSRIGPSRRQQHTLTFTPVRGNVYRATPEQPLPAGEYGFYYASVPSLASYEFLAASGSVGGRIFSFGVDEG